MTADERLSKVPAVTLAFWVAKIAATTLGETGGDAVSMTLNLGYLAATGIFAVIFLIALALQVGAKFRREVLASGGSRPALESFVAFRGRKPQIDALLRHNGMTLRA